MTSNYAYCLNCKEYTGTSDLRIVDKATAKLGTIYSINGTCSDCRKLKSRRIGKVLPTGYTLDSTAEQISKLLTGAKKQGGSLDNTMTAETPVIVAMTADDIDGEGFWDSIKNIGKKKTFADKVGDTAAKFTKSAVRSIPFVGDLLANSGIVDAGIDWISDNVWQPIKNHFGWALDDVLKDKLKNNDIALQDVLEKLFEVRVKTGDGIVPTYIGELREGSNEDKALAHVLMKTLCKPKFYKFLKDEQVPSSMSIIEAFTKYKSKPKTYKNQEEKAQQILTSLGYSFT